MDINNLIDIIFQRKKTVKTAPVASDNPIMPVTNGPDFTIVSRDGQEWKYCKRIHTWSEEACSSFNKIMRQLEKNKNVHINQKWSTIDYDDNGQHVVEVFWRNKTNE